MSAHRPSGVYVSEQSLPDKLSHALKGIFHTTKSPGSSSTTRVAADMIYYPSAKTTAHSSPYIQSPVVLRTNPALAGHAHRASYDSFHAPSNASTMESSTTPSKANLSVPSATPFSTNKSSNSSLTSLEQLRQMYNSAPDFSPLFDEDDEENICELEDDDRVPSTSSSALPPTGRASKTTALSMGAPTPPTQRKMPLVDHRRQSTPVSHHHYGRPIAVIASKRPSPLTVKPPFVPVDEAPVESPIYANIDDYTPVDETARAFSQVVNGAHTDPTVVVQSATPLIDHANNTSDTSASPTDSGYRSSSRHLDGPTMPLSPIAVDAVEQSATTGMPWTEKEIVCVLQRGRLKAHAGSLGVDVVARLSEVMRRPLVRLAAHLHRLTHQLGYCAVRDVAASIDALLPRSLATPCHSAAVQAVTYYSMETEESTRHSDILRQSRSARCHLHLSVCRLHQWTIEMRMCACTNELAIVYLTAALECLLEEIVLRSVAYHARALQSGMLCASMMDECIAEDAALYGLLSPASHLIVGRTATKPTRVQLDSSLLPAMRETNGMLSTTSFNDNLVSAMTTLCVKNAPTLGMSHKQIGDQRIAESLVSRVHKGMAKGTESTPLHWTVDALRLLFAYMRCDGSSCCSTPAHSEPLVTALESGRCRSARPPLHAFVDMATVHARHARSSAILAAHVRSAGHVLLPWSAGVVESMSVVSRSDACPLAMAGTTETREMEIRRYTAQQLLSTNDESVIDHCADLLGTRGLNTRLAPHGLTPLMQCVLDGQHHMVDGLSERGADVNAAVGRSADARHTMDGARALHLAVCAQNRTMVDVLIRRCALVDSDPHNEEATMEAPLQLAVMAGDANIIGRLMECEADAFRTTIACTPEGYGYRRRGALAPIALAAQYGRRRLLHHMLGTATRPGHQQQALSLTDFVSETRTVDEDAPTGDLYSRLSRRQQRALQDASYAACEHGQMHVAIELRNVGVPWTLYTWCECLVAVTHAHGQSIDRRQTTVHALLLDVTDALLGHVTQDFVDDGIPVLFDTIRHSVALDRRDTAVLAADIVRRLYVNAGGEMERVMRSESIVEDDPSPTTSLIDASFVNNAELSDMTFEIDGRLFYAHRIVLVNASPVFKTMITQGKGQRIILPTLDYGTFTSVMHYVYGGSLPARLTHSHSVADLLLVVHVARELQLTHLLRHCHAHLSSRLSVATCLPIYEYALSQAIEWLSTECERFVLGHLREVVCEAEFARQCVEDDGPLLGSLIAALTHRLQPGQ